LINSTNADITHMEMDKKNFSISNWRVLLNISLSKPYQ
jgi:hypothetical protein